MTVSSQVSSVSYLGDGVTTLLPVPYYFLEQGHLLVTRVNVDTTTTTLVLGSDYSVSGAGNQAGGSITMFAAPAVGVQTIIERAVPATQETDYVANDPFPAESHERALDKLTMLTQQNGNTLARALLRPIGKSYFDAENRLIKNLGDGGDDPDAVNIRTMRAYVDLAVAGVIGGAGFFQQSGAGALERTFQEKMRDIVTKGDFPSAQAAALPALNKPFHVPDDSSVVLNVPGDVATLYDALSAIAEWYIPASSLVTINVAEGLTVSANTVIVDHPNGENILIRGAANPLSCTITSFNAVSGVRGNYLVTLNVSSSAGLLAGHWVAIRDTVGTGRHRVMKGFYEIVSIPSGTTIQVRVRLWDAAFPAMTFSAGNVYRVRSLLKFNDKDGIVLRSSTVTIYDLGVLGNMWDYWLEGDITGTEKGTHGVYVSSNTIIDGAGTPGGANPYGLAGGALACVGLHVADFDQQGFTAAGGAGIFGRNMYAASCGRRGMYVGTSAGIETKFSYVTTCYRDGIIADYGGAFNGSLVYSNGNRLAGGFANNGGSFISPNSEFTGNLFGLDIRAGSGGYCDASVLNLNNQNGASYEYGAKGSLSGSDLSSNTVDGLAAIFSAAIRTTNATINNNGRYGINALDASIGRSGATITGNVTANINADALSVIFDGTNYEPSGNPVPVYEWRVTDSAKVHTTRATVSGIGDFALSIDGNARLVLKADGTLHPSGDNTQTLGRSANRWSVVYAGTGTINTSDEDYKQDIKPIDDACLRAWANVEYVQYKFKDAVEQKADGARWHFGLIAQRVEAAFAAEGIDARDYGLLCYDEWPASPDIYTEKLIGNLRDADTGEIIAEGVENQVTPAGMTWELTSVVPVLVQQGAPAGKRYGIRYEEALALECAYLRSKLGA